MADRRRSARMSPESKARGNRSRTPAGASNLAVGGNRIMGTVSSGPLQKRPSPFNRSRLDQLQVSFKQDLSYLQGRILSIDQMIGRRKSLDARQAANVSDQFFKSMIDDCSDPNLVIKREGYSSFEEAVCTQALILQLTGVLHARLGACGDKLLEKAKQSGYSGGRRSSTERSTGYDLVNGPPSYPALINRFLDILTSSSSTNEGEMFNKLKEKLIHENAEWQKKYSKQASELESLRSELENQVDRQKKLLAQTHEAQDKLKTCKEELDALRNADGEPEDSGVQKRLTSMNEFLMWTMQFLEDGKNYDMVEGKATAAGGRITIRVLQAIEAFRESRERCQELVVQTQKLERDLRESRSQLELMTYDQESLSKLRQKNQKLQAMVDELTVQNQRLQDAQSNLHSRMNSQKGRKDIMSTLQNIDDVIESEMSFLNINIRKKVQETTSQLDVIAEKNRMERMESSLERQSRKSHQL